MRLYHGSTMTVRKPVISRARSKTDFGKGFYTTTSREQAEKWAQIKKKREGDDANIRAIVSVFEFDEKLLNSARSGILPAPPPWLPQILSQPLGCTILSQATVKVHFFHYVAYGAVCNIIHNFGSVHLRLPA